MKLIAYLLILSISFSPHSTYSMQHALSDRNMQMFCYVAAGCTALLYITYHYKDSVADWWHRLKDNESEHKNNSSPDKKEQKLTPTPDKLTPDALAKLVEQYEQTKEKEKATLETTPLHEACEKNNEKEVKKLLSDPTIDVNAKVDLRDNSNKGWTALHMACQKNHENIINLLLGHPNINVSIHVKSDITPLYYACLHNNREVARRLLAHKTMVLDNNLPLRIACEKGHLELVQLLLKYNTNNCMKINDVFGWPGKHNPLTQACSCLQDCINDEKVYTILAEEIANNKGKVSHSNLWLWDIPHRHFLPGNTQYCINKIYEVANPLQKAQEQIKILKEQRTIFFEIIKELLNDPFISFKQIGNEPSVFHYVVVDHEVLQLFFEKNKTFAQEDQCNIDATNKDNKTPLHSAVIAGNLQSIQCLLDYGADITIQPNRERTAFEKACYNVWHEHDPIKRKPLETIVTYLLPRIAHDADQLSHGAQELINASTEKDYTLLELLLKNGADPNRGDHQNNGTAHTSMFKAARFNRLFLLNVFINDYNGNIAQKNNLGYTVFYAAFMQSTIKEPHDIDYLKKLDDDQKKAFMQQELIAVVEWPSPDRIFFTRCWNCACNRDEEPHYLQRFNDFVTTCIEYGNIDVHEPIIGNRYTLLEKAYERLSSYNPQVALSHYNEAIVHALIKHYPVDSLNNARQKTDLAIAMTYKNDPQKYYLFPTKTQGITKEAVMAKYYTDEV